MVATLSRKRQAEAPLLPMRADKQRKTGPGFFSTIFNLIVGTSSDTPSNSQKSPKKTSGRPSDRRHSFHGDKSPIQAEKSLRRASGMPSTTQRSAAAFATHQQDENEESQASKSIPFHPQPQLIRPTSLADRLATEPTHIYTPVGTPLPPPADDEAPSEPTKPPPPKTNSGTMSYNASPRGEIIDLTGHDSEANGSQSPQLPSTSTSLTAQTTVEAVDEPPQRDNLHPRTRKISGKTILRTSLQHAPEMRDRRIGHNATRWIPIDRVHAEKEKQSSSGSSDRKSSYSSSQASSSKSANPSTSSLDTLASRVRNTGLTSQGSSKLSLQSQNFTFGQSAQPPRQVNGNGGGSKRRVSSPKPNRPVNKKYVEKPHILNSKHKAELAARTAAVRQSLKEELSHKFKARGFYLGTEKEFDDLFDYAFETKKVMSEESQPRGMWPDFADMRKSLAVYFDKVAKTHNEPKVNEWAPTLEHLNKKLRDRRAAIDRQRQVKLPDSLPDEDEQAVERLFKTPGVISKCAREQVTNSDIRRLLPRSWLNDEIINFYGAMLNERSDKRDAKDPRSKLLNAYYLSTFFWAKLVKDGYEKGRLSKWTKKVDIFSKDVILIPVNHRNQHWTAAAINFKAKRFESYDSLNMAGEEVCERLREYVAAEHLNKKKKPFDFTGWKSHVAEDTPQQENGYDCGVFTCQALESLSRGEDKFIFSQKDMMYLRRRMVWEIGHAQLRQDA